MTNGECQPPTLLSRISLTLNASYWLKLVRASRPL
jgi:hypothetical protein